VDKPASGDWDLRGPDFDTALIGPVTESIGDADRLVKREWQNGFPNWWLYRCAYAGDSLGLENLRQWCVAFSVTFCKEGAVKRSVYSDELATVAAWDALHAILYCRELQPYTVSAAALGVDPKTYKRLRDRLYRRLRGSLEEYWIQLGAAYRHIILYERRTYK
jgi:hypothetical protein